MATLKALEREVGKIKERNKKVEKDKAWEISWTRRVLVFVLTYVVILVFFLVAGLPNPYVNSLIPALAFILSTLGLGFFKKLWMKYN